MLRNVTCLARLSPRLSSLPRRARRTFSKVTPQVLFAAIANCKHNIVAIVFCLHQSNQQSANNLIDHMK
jgi:hypothetical protein